MLYRKPKKRRGLKILLGLVVLLVAGRLALPYVLEAWIERKPSDSPYVVTLDDLDINLWRGSYEVEGLRIERTDLPASKEPFFAAQKVDLSVEWVQIFRGAVVGEAVFHKPVLHYVAAERAPETEGAPEPDWRRRLESMFPFQINRIVIHDGSVAYARRATSPFTMRLDKVEAEVTNLTNAAKLAARPAKLELAGTAMNEAKVSLEMTANPFAKRPEFTLDAKLTELQLVNVGGLLRSFGNVDVEGGTFEAFVDLEAKDGKFKGVVRPLFENVGLSRWQEDEGDDAFSQLKRGLTRRLEEEARRYTGDLPDRFTARIPVSGAFPDDMNVWAAGGIALRSAVAEALSVGLERMLGEKLRRG